MKIKYILLILLAIGAAIILYQQIYHGIQAAKEAAYVCAVALIFIIACLWFET